MTPVDANRDAQQWLHGFAAALDRREIDGAADCFGETCYWRDLLAFTWNIRTQEGRPAIAAMLSARLADTEPQAWRLNGDARHSGEFVEAALVFETRTARADGYVRLKNGKCWTLMTAMRELKGFEEKRGPTRVKGAEHGAHAERVTWLDARNREQAELGRSRQPYCLIVGGGQGGLALGARLKQLGVPALIVDKHARAGDAWRSRYKSLCLHDPVWYDHLPYLPFPDHWPVFTPKDKMGDWLEMYAKVMELDCWFSTSCEKAEYDASDARWNVRVNRSGEVVTLRPAHLILATGMSGVPNMPQFPGMETFEGIQHHSSRHPGGEAFRGKSCVVVGANNSAHDIAADLWEHGARVTMIQRSPTLVVRSETLMELALGRLYSEEAMKAGITTEKADLLAASIPSAVLPQFQKPIWKKIAERDAAFYDRLRAAGFMLTFGEDESGLSAMYHRRGSGYYIDVGASDLIAAGEIKLRSKVDIARVARDRVVLSDGSEIPANLIVYATGYGSMNGWAAGLISQEVADKVGKCWGLGSGTAKDPGPWEGELRNMWKPTQQPGLWFHGGNLAQSRHYSRYLALQLKARMEGLPTQVYGMTAPHHAA